MEQINNIAQLDASDPPAIELPGYCPSCSQAAGWRIVSRTQPIQEPDGREPQMYLGWTDYVCRGCGKSLDWGSQL